MSDKTTPTDPASLNALRRLGQDPDEVETYRRVGRMPCIVTGKRAAVASLPGGGFFDLVPLTRDLRTQPEEIGVDAFQAVHGVGLRAEADRIALEHPRPLGIRGLADRWTRAARIREIAATIDLDQLWHWYPSPSSGTEWCTSKQGVAVELSALGCAALRHRVASDPDAAAQCDESCWPNGIPSELVEDLDDEERDALFGWVRRRIDREEERLRDERGQALGEGMLMDYVLGSDWHPNDDRDALARAVADELGVTDEQARLLIEAATEGRWTS